MTETTAEKQTTKSGETYERVVQLLEKSCTDLKQALAGLPDEFCSKKPADNCWSITEVVEHILMLEERVPRMLRAKLPEQEVTADLSSLRERDAVLVEQVASDKTRIEAPDAVRPAGQFESCRQAMDSFSAARQRTLEYAAAATPYLSGRLLPHPLLGPIDGYHWLLALAAQTQRHTKQINGIKVALQSESGSSS